MTDLSAAKLQSSSLGALDSGGTSLCDAPKVSLHEHGTQEAGNDSFTNSDHKAGDAASAFTTEETSRDTSGGDREIVKMTNHTDSSIAVEGEELHIDAQSPLSDRALVTVIRAGEESVISALVTPEEQTYGSPAFDGGKDHKAVLLREDWNGGFLSEEKSHSQSSLGDVAHLPQSDTSPSERLQNDTGPRSSDITADSSKVKIDESQVCDLLSDNVTGFDNLHATEVDSQDTKIDSHTTEVDSHATVVVSHATEVDFHATEVDSHATEVDSQDTEIDSHATEVDSHDTEVDLQVPVVHGSNALHDSSPITEALNAWPSDNESCNSGTKTTEWTGSDFGVWGAQDDSCVGWADFASGPLAGEPTASWAQFQDNEVRADPAALDERLEAESHFNKSPEKGDSEIVCDQVTFHSHISDSSHSKQADFRDFNAFSDAGRHDEEAFGKFRNAAATSDYAQLAPAVLHKGNDLTDSTLKPPTSERSGGGSWSSHAYEDSASHRISEADDEFGDFGDGSSVVSSNLLEAKPPPTTSPTPPPQITSQSDFTLLKGLLQPLKQSDHSEHQDQQMSPSGGPPHQCVGGLTPDQIASSPPNSDLPQVEFDWSSSGLMNPLEAQNLNLDFFDDTLSAVTRRAATSELEQQILAGDSNESSDEVVGLKKSPSSGASSLDQGSAGLVAATTRADCVATILALSHSSSSQQVTVLTLGSRDNA